MKLEWEQGKDHSRIGEWQELRVCIRMCVCLCVCVVCRWEESCWELLGGDYFSLFNCCFATLWDKASSAMQIPVQFYSLTTGVKYFDIGKPMDLSVFFKIFPWWDGSFLAHWSLQHHGIHCSSLKERQGKMVQLRAKRVIREVTVTLFNEHMEDTASAPKLSEFSRSWTLI